VERRLDPLVAGKQRHAFETIEQQMGFFDGLPLESQLAMLDSGSELLIDLSAMDAQFRQMVTEWMAGDPEGLAATVNEEWDDAALFQALLTNRNAAWAEWLDARMDQPGIVFVAVGAGHLGGADSVQHFLAERGFTVERVAH
jgi:hypothetical protein